MGVASEKPKVANAVPMEGRVQALRCVSVSAFERVGEAYTDAEVMFAGSQRMNRSPSFELDTGKENMDGSVGVTGRAFNTFLPRRPETKFNSRTQPSWDDTSTRAPWVRLQSSYFQAIAHPVHLT